MPYEVAFDDRKGNDQAVKVSVGSAGSGAAASTAELRARFSRMLGAEGNPITYVRTYVLYVRTYVRNLQYTMTVHSRLLHHHSKDYLGAARLALSCISFHDMHLHVGEWQDILSEVSMVSGAMNCSQCAI